MKRHIGAAWASVRKYSSQLYDRKNARLSLKIRLFKAEVMDAMLYRCATWTLRSQDFSSLRTAHHKLFVFFLRYTIRESGMGHAPVLFFIFYFSAANLSRCFSLYLFTSLIPLFDLIAVPLSLLLHFYFAVWRTRCPCPCLPI